MTSSDHNHIHAFWCGLSVLLLTDMIEVVVIDCRFCLTMIQPSWCWWCLQSTTNKTISNYQKFADCQAEVRLVTSWGGSFPVTSLATTRGGSRQVLQRHGSESRQKRNCRSKEKKRNIDGPQWPQVEEPSRNRTQTLALCSYNMLIICCNYVICLYNIVMISENKRHGLAVAPELRGF